MRGKYSPAWVQKDCVYNCYGKETQEYSGIETEFDEKTMFANYDDEGFDRYGYSAFDAEGNYCGIGEGIDRLGNTEFDYMCMSQEEFENKFS